MENEQDVEPMMDETESQEEMAADVTGMNVSFSDGLAGSVRAGQDVIFTDAAAGAVAAQRDINISSGGGVAIAAGRDMTIEAGGSWIMAVGHDMQITNGGGGMMNVGGQVNARNSTLGVVISGQVNLEEGSKVMFSTQQAAAFGAAFAVVFGILSWLLRRR